ncbi:3923_t:CDS:2, partial [Dentiscutata erythropus]
VEMSINRLEISNTVSGSYFRIWLFILFLLYSNFLYTSEEPDLENLSLKDDFEKFAERLELNKFTENKNEWKKFYGFVWPSTNINERRLIFDYVVDPDWDPIGEELAANIVVYSNQTLLIHHKEYPGCYFVPVEKRIVELRKFSTIDNNTNKEWQWEWRECQGFRNVIDTGATMTVIPYFVRQKLYSRQDGWKTIPIEASGYSDGVKIFQASRDWYICLGDGTNWSG